MGWITMMAASGMFNQPPTPSLPNKSSTDHDWQPLRPDTWWRNFLHGRTKLWICGKCRRLITRNTEPEARTSVCPGEPMYVKRQRPQR